MSPADYGTGPSMNQPRVSVVIPNWNGLEHLAECMDSLANQSYRDFETIVVDNASSDGSVAWLREHVPETRLVVRNDNGGFSAAVNDGIRASQAEFVYLLNNDTAVDPDCLRALVEALDSTGYDVATSLMVFYDEPNVVNAAGDIFLLGHLFGIQRGRGEPVAAYAEPMRVFGACAGAAMYRRSFFDDVGLFDEEFFLIFEDVDISLRGLIAGKRVHYVPGSVVRHKDSASIKTRPSLQTAHLMLRNRFIVIGKDLPLVLMPYAALWWCWNGFREVVPLRPSRWHEIPALLAEYRAGVPTQFEGFRMGWAKRPDVWKRQRISVAAILRWLHRGSGPLD